MSTLSSNSAPQAVPASGHGPVPSAAEFNEAIKYVLVNDKGMPPLVADSVMQMDSGFLERCRNDARNKAVDVVAIADELVMQPNVRARWVDLNEASREEGDATGIVISAGTAIDHHLNSLLAMGLYGHDRTSVANAVFLRGLEALLPVVAMARQPGLGTKKAK
ncbi:hypothetical protein [Duganella vulcania]|uniref:Uncharacterized protein n=1 Tax=Duganella vulcania TaxID=2692166 RepID=A0A845GHN1_9BURK|nr:hypothetical protein [Duganella vulcania]MYM92816.1 hypothetical protein [Duganella vulcania]